MEIPIINERLIDSGPKIFCLPDDAFGSAFLRQLTDHVKSNLKAVVVNTVKGKSAEAVDPDFLELLSEKIDRSVPIAISSMTNLIGNGDILLEPRRTVVLLSETLHQCNEAVTILAFSSMTDLAVLLMTEPILKRKIARIVLPEHNALDYRGQGFACGGILDPESTFFMLRSDLPILFLTAETLRADSLTVSPQFDSCLVDVDLDGWTTRGTYIVDGLQLMKRTPNVTVVHYSPFLI